MAMERPWIVPSCFHASDLSKDVAARAGKKP